MEKFLGKVGKLIDLTGNVYNHLTVICRGEDLIKKNGKHETRWLCKCDCGNPNNILVLGYNLKNGNTQSCGCVHLQNAREQGRKNGPVQGKLNKKYNTYDLTGDYGIGYTLSGDEFYFDLEDYHLIKDYCWYKNEDGYIINKTTSDAILMHRLVMGLSSEDPYVVDHIFHVNYDNRKSKLRIVTFSQNNMNRYMSSNNTSGIKGVWFDKKNGEWAAEIGVNKQKIHLGEFENIIDAEKVRCAAEEKYFGEYNLKRGDDSYDKY